MGDITGDEPVLGRIHSECLTGDALFSLRCDCGFQLQAALENIAKAGRGVLLYVRQEGRGIGLLNKIRAYHLQDQGADTVEANVALGFAADMRDYTICADMLKQLEVKSLKLMTNNPRKMKAMESFGIPVAERVPCRKGAIPTTSSTSRPRPTSWITCSRSDLASPLVAMKNASHREAFFVALISPQR